MPQFTELPQAHGWGNWHVNRFRVVFRLPPGRPPMTSAQLAGHFINNFPAYVNSPKATVQHFQQGNDSLYKFHGAVPILKLGVPHYDWVKVIWMRPTQGFTVQTLHRDTPDADDGQMAMFGAKSGAIGGGVAALPVPELEPSAILGGAVIGGVSAFIVNRFHILSGRRSWLLRPANTLNGPHDPNLPATDFVLETAAIERISIPVLLPMTPLIESLLPGVWQNLLANFITRFGLQQVQYAQEAGWQITPTAGIDVHWFALDLRAEADIYKSPYAVDVLRTFYGILDTSSKPTHELQQLLDKIESMAALMI